MLSERPTDESSDTPTGEILGKLPRERPGKRSPRRDARPPGGEPEPSGPGSGSSEGGGSGAQDATGDSQIRGIEDLAWGGVAIAAEAATLGLRLASRAIDAVRGPTERS